MSWRDEVIRMLQESGYIDWLASHNIQLGSMDSPQEEIERFAALVAAAKQEQCAKRIKEVESTGWPENTEYGSYGEFDDAVKAIRALKDEVSE